MQLLLGGGIKQASIPDFITLPTSTKRHVKGRRSQSHLSGDKNHLKAFCLQQKESISPADTIDTTIANWNGAAKIFTATGKFYFSGDASVNLNVILGARLDCMRLGDRRGGCNSPVVSSW